MRQLVRLAVELGISQVAVADGSGDRVRRPFDLLFDQLVDSFEIIFGALTWQWCGHSAK